MKYKSSEKVKVKEENKKDEVKENIGKSQEMLKLKLQLITKIYNTIKYNKNSARSIFLSTKCYYISK